MFWVLKKTISLNLDGSFEYPQHMLWSRNKKNSYLIHTFNQRLDCEEVTEHQQPHDSKNTIKVKQLALSSLVR